MGDPVVEQLKRSAATICKSSPFRLLDHWIAHGEPYRVVNVALLGLPRRHQFSTEKIVPEVVHTPIHIALRGGAVN